MENLAPKRCGCGLKRLSLRLRDGSSRFDSHRIIRGRRYVRQGGGSQRSVRFTRDASSRPRLLEDGCFPLPFSVWLVPAALLIWCRVLRLTARHLMIALCGPLAERHHVHWDLTAAGPSPEVGTIDFCCLRCSHSLRIALYIRVSWRVALVNRSILFCGRRSSPQ